LYIEVFGIEEKRREEEIEIESIVLTDAVYVCIGSNEAIR
jgi:hypothetical protein